MNDKQLVDESFLMDLLCVRRGAGGNGAANTQRMLVKTIKALGYAADHDEAGNVICNVSGTTEVTTVLFSCHTDAVHFGEGFNELSMSKDNILTAYTHEPSSYKLTRTQLGADDGAGVYIMMCMIQAGIPGMYVFHAEEEIGCLGSKYIVAKEEINGIPLTHFTHAIAFDRKGTQDLISHQLGDRMCSTSCVEELRVRLNTDTPLNYKEEHGVITDTAIYADLIPECINLSVGYENEHRYSEYLDLNHVRKLVAVVTSDKDLFHALPVDRDCDQAPNRHPRVGTVEELVYNEYQGVAELLETLGYDYTELKLALSEEGWIC